MAKSGSAFNTTAQLKNTLTQPHNNPLLDRLKQALPHCNISENKLHANNIHSTWHAKALIYLVKIRELDSNIALSYLNGLSVHEARAVFYGVPKDDVIDLNIHLIEVMIERKQTDGLLTRKQVEDLGKHQINVVREFYHFGITAQDARSIADSPLALDCFNHFLLASNYHPLDCVNMMRGLAQAQLHGLLSGLNRREVADLNKYQIDALMKYKHALNADDFRNTPWFTSDTYVSALGNLIESNSAKQALKKLASSTISSVRLQAIGFAHLHLNHIHIKAIENNELIQHGLCPSHLNGKYWINSPYHLFALEHLILHKGMEACAAVDELHMLSADAVKLIYRYEGLSRSAILNLTHLQPHLLINLSNYGFRSFAEAISASKWLTTMPQANMLEKIYERLEVHDYALTLVKHYSQRPLNLEMLDRLLNAPLTTNKTLRLRAEKLMQIANAQSFAESASSTTREDTSTLRFTALNVANHLMKK